MFNTPLAPSPRPVTDDELDARGRIGALRGLLADDGRPRDERLSRLQGWRGTDLAAAVEAGRVRSLAPAACGIATLAAAASGSVPLVLVILATAVVGMVAANHPVEQVYNAIAIRRGRPVLPANRAAKRLGCAVGSMHLAGGALALTVGATTLANVLLVSLGVLALFVAVTGICVPSMMYTLQFGARRATAARLFG